LFKYEQALFSGEGKKMSPKTHLSSDLNEFNSKSRIGTEDLRRSEQIGAYKTK